MDTKYIKEIIGNIETYEENIRKGRELQWAGGMWNSETEAIERIFLNNLMKSLREIMKKVGEEVE